MSLKKLFSSIESEYYVLSAMMQNHVNLAIAKSKLKPKHFYDTKNRTIFTAIIESCKDKKLTQYLSTS